MSVQGFLELTPKEFYLSLKNKNDHDGMLVESNVKIICDTIRVQTYYQLNVQLAKKDKVKKPSDLIAFPWDDKTVKRQTKKQMVNVMKAIAGHFNKEKK